MTSIVRCAAAATLALTLGAGCHYSEDYFDNQIAALDRALAKASPRVKAKYAARKKQLLAEKARLPRGDRDAYDELCYRANKVMKAAKEEVEAAAAVARAEANKASPEYRRLFHGVWKGPGMELTITGKGQVRYKRNTGKGTRSFSGMLMEFRKDRFKAGVLGLGTTFKIDRPPHKEGETWKMTIDGVELTRTMAWIQARMGLTLCAQLKRGICIEGATAFKRDTAKIYATYAAREVPAEGTPFALSWVAADAGGVKDKVLTVTRLEAGKLDRRKGSFFHITGSLSRPTRGWPVGTYRLDVLKKDARVASAEFTVSADAAAPPGAPAGAPAK